MATYQQREQETKRAVKELQQTINQARADLAGDEQFTSPPSPALPLKTLDQKIRKQQIENDNIEKDQKLKETTLRILFYFLTAETAVIFCLAFFQGFSAWGFHLEEWSFRLVIAGTLSQIAAMLIIAVKNLFPGK
ncbi:MAG TPA: hypothetical protein VK497_03385 [Candidatus Saccharimonadales bacterium]|nr:hypothetical protein [Candidatus Saccharimonadales bacterium]